MRMRFPRPLRGWHAFLDEILIVVVGVFIALAAQSWLEERSWRQRTLDARQAMSEEIAAHYANAVEWRVAQPCIVAQLDRLERRLNTARGSLVAAPIHSASGRRFVIRAPNRPYVDTSWQAAVAEGVSSHFPAGERLDIGAHFERAAEMKSHNNQFRQVVTRLNSMGRPIPLDPSARLALMQALDEARDLNNWLGLMGGQLVSAVTELKMVPDQALVREVTDESATVRFCRDERLPVLPFVEALRPLE